MGRVLINLLQLPDKVINILLYNGTAALQESVKLPHAEFPMFLDSTFRVIGSFSAILTQNTSQTHSQGRAMRTWNISEAHPQRLRTQKVGGNPLVNFLKSVHGTRQHPRGGGREALSNTF